MKFYRECNKDGSLWAGSLPQEEKNLILGALDSCAVALANHDHQWTTGERCIYEAAVELTAKPAHTETGKAQHSPLPKSQSIEGDGTNMQLYVRSMGKLLAVTAIFTNDNDANAYCERHNDEGVVAQGGGLIFTANLYDKGTHAESPQTTDRTRLFTVASVNHADKLAEALRMWLSGSGKDPVAASRQALAAYEAAQ